LRVGLVYRRLAFFSADGCDGAISSKFLSAKAVRMSSETEVERRPCPMCGKMIVKTARKCRHCGEELRPKQQQSNEAVAGLIPYKNPPALLAYYLGLFSLLPCFPLGIAAFVLGIIGLRNVKRNPKLRGTVHAWIGVVMGFLFGGLWTVATIFALLGAAMSNR
jgi:predicted RNA-binding Zn-ribbon protein involved in translation (DUF1610 family)